MSAAGADAEECPFGDGRCSPPEFDLRYAVDDPADPAEVTIYPSDADEAALVTTWVSADADAAVSLDAIR